MCRINLLPYYLSKVILITKKYYQSLKNVPLRVKNHILAIYMFDSDSIMIYSNPITSVVNTLKSIYFAGALLDEFTSEYNNNKNYTFGMLFQKIYS